MFCPHCGAKQEVEQAKFCGSCGRPLDSAQSLEGEARPEPSQVTANDGLPQSRPASSGQAAPTVPTSGSAPGGGVKKGVDPKVLAIIAAAVVAVIAIVIVVVFVVKPGGGSAPAPEPTSTSGPVDTQSAEPTNTGEPTNTQTNGSNQSPSGSNTGSGGSTTDDSGKTQKIGSKKVGFVQVPASWKDNTKAMDERTVEDYGLVLYIDPDSSYKSKAQGGTSYGKAIQLTVQPTSYTEVAKGILESYKSDSKFGETTQGNIEIAGRKAIVLVTTLKDDNLQLATIVLDRDGDGKAAVAMALNCGFDEASSKAVLKVASTWTRE